METSIPSQREAILVLPLRSEPCINFTALPHKIDPSQWPCTAHTEMGTLTTLANSVTTGWKKVLLEATLPDADYDQELKSMGDLLPCHPAPENIFRCFTYFEPEDTRVVILGQDPYHGCGEAIGLCFGTEQDALIPPSLRNIEKALVRDLDRPLGDYTLEAWAKQGVLLLNTALTVRHKSPSSHLKWWTAFTDSIVQYLNQQCTGIVFVAWGAFAHQRLSSIDMERHHLFISSHPSPLSCNRPYKGFPPFSTTRPFSQINGLLKKEISW